MTPVPWINKQQAQPVFNMLLKSFFQGLMIVGPFGLTVFFIWYIVSSVDNLYPAISAKYPGVVFISIICTITLLGFLGNKFLLGRLLLDRMDLLLEKTPGIKHIYTPTKDVMSSFVGDKKKFTRPVWVKISTEPLVWRIGFQNFGICLHHYHS